MGKVEELRKLGKSVEGCRKCALCVGRNNLVFGEGSARAEVMFIGEGPGAKEDEQGRPFVGAAGKLLDEMLSSVDLDRNSVYIANVVKCRPPGNRDPLPEEVKACWPYLEDQVKIIRPKLVVLLGRHSLERFLPGQRISEVHGKALRRDFSGVGSQVFFAAYHPAAALYQGSLRETLFRDFGRVPKILKLIAKEKTPKVEPTREGQKKEGDEQNKLF